MANKNAPFGARVVGKLGSGVANGGQQNIELPLALLGIFFQAI